MVSFVFMEVPICFPTEKSLGREISLHQAHGRDMVFTFYNKNSVLYIAMNKSYQIYPSEYL